MGRQAAAAPAVGEKQPHGLAWKIEEGARAGEKEDARELLVHRIVEAIFGDARRGSRPGWIAAAHAPELEEDALELEEDALELEEDARELEVNARELEEDVAGGPDDARR
ncbi:uncharacterized protein LOC125531803 [Triticum urartu]|uniref:uncharacterized protein LOC125531803 n=1 Tax=Triticum urartu TaxID=4572 RepID=UPI002044BA88|nr:uncharacterized protein LOC125531803 [Triticum urartu]